MSHYRRSNAAGATFFFTVTTCKRRPVLVEDAVRSALRQAIVETRIRFPFEIHAWVLLPDHLHCLWELPEGDSDFARRWALIKRQTSQKCSSLFDNSEQSASRQRRRELPFWQRRFWEHQIRNDTDFKRHADYIHWNPVKHGLVRRAADWPWSTFHRYQAQGIYSPDWCNMDDGDIGGE
jgi:putative transposase